MSDSFDSSISTPVTEIDFEHLNRYVAGDPDLTREVFGLFRNQVEIWGRGLRADVDDDMWANVTHSLKGSARAVGALGLACLLYTSPSPRDKRQSRMPSSA